MATTAATTDALIKERMRMRKSMPEVKEVELAIKELTDAREKDPDYKEFSEITGYPHSKGKFFFERGKTWFDRNDWSEEEQQDIPEYPEFYCRDENADLAGLLALENGFSCVYHGYPGSYKDVGILALAAWTNHPYHRITCTGDTTLSSILGDRTIEGTAIRYAEGPLPIYARKGYLLVVSEPYAAPPSTNGAYQPLLERGGRVELLDNPDPAGRVVHPDPRFRIFFTSNVAGTGDDMDLYAQTKLQDTSLLSRVDIRVIRDYPARDEEFRALKNAYPDKVSKYEGKVMKLIQLANLLRTSFKQKNLPTVFSTRQVYTALCLMESITSIKTVIDMVYSNDLKAQAERDLVLTSMNSVGF